MEAKVIPTPMLRLT